MKMRIAFLGYLLLNCVLFAPSLSATSPVITKQPPAPCAPCALSATSPIITEKPPALGDLFYMVRYKDGSAKLFQNLTSSQLKDLNKDPNVTRVVETTYGEIATSLTQRVYDYQ